MLFGKHKYRAKKAHYAGISFDSQLERDVYGMLLLLQKSGSIEEIKVKDHVYLTKARVLYIADFKCTTPLKNEFWVEAKGFETREWRIKRKLWGFYGPGKLEVWRRRGKAGVYIHETIAPEEENVD